jgi:hypothetical protein
VLYTGSGGFSWSVEYRIVFTLMELYELRILIKNRKGDALTNFASFCLCVFVLLAVNAALCMYARVMPC